jgi:hypothetical protein
MTAQRIRWISDTDAKEIVRDVYQATNFGKLHLHHMTLGDQQTGDNQRLHLGVLQRHHLSIYYVRPKQTVSDTRAATHVSRWLNRDNQSKARRLIRIARHARIRIEKESMRTCLPCKEKKKKNLRARCFV